MYYSPDTCCLIREVIVSGSVGLDHSKTLLLEHESELNIYVQFAGDSDYASVKDSTFCYRQLQNFEWKEDTIFVEMREVECYEDETYEEDEDFIYFINASPSFTKENYLHFPIKTSFEDSQVLNKTFRVEFRFIIQKDGKCKTNSFFLIFRTVPNNKEKPLSINKKIKFQEREIKVGVNKSFHFMYEINNKRIQFQKDYHNHFNISSKKFDLKSSQKSYNISKILNIPLDTFRESFNAIASRKFNKKTKSCIIFVIGNGIDPAQIPKKRITILRNSDTVPPVGGRFNNFQQTHLINTLIDCCPFCPIIFYDLNNGNTVTTKDIQLSLRFVYERSRIRADKNNVIVLSTWSYIMNQKIDELDNSLNSFKNLTNVALLCSAGNQGQNIDNRFIYPNCAKEVITIGSVNIDRNTEEIRRLDISNFGKTVDFYVNSENTAYAAMYAVTMFSLLWLLDSNCSSESVREIILNKCCGIANIPDEIDEDEMEQIKVMNKCSQAVEYLLGKKIKKRDNCTKFEEIIDENESEEETVGVREPNVAFNTTSSEEELADKIEIKEEQIDGGIYLEEDGEDSDAYCCNDSDIEIENELTIGGKDGSEIKLEIKKDFDFNELAKHFLNSLIKEHRKSKNLLFEVDALECTISNDDNITEMILENNLNKIQIFGNQGSGKTILGKKIVCKICQHSLKNFKKESLIPIWINDLSQSKELTKIQKIVFGYFPNVVIIIDNFIPTESNLRKITSLKKVIIITSFEITSLNNYYKVQMKPLPLSFIRNNIIKKYHPKLNYNKKFILFTSYPSLFCLIYTDLKRKEKNLKERTKLFNITPYLIIQGIIEDLTYEFVTSVTIDLKTKKYLRKLTIPIFSLFAYNCLMNGKNDFREINIQEKKYDFFITILQNNLQNFKIISKVCINENENEDVFYRFGDLLFEKFLASHHIRNMITSILIYKKKKIEAVENIYSLFYNAFFDPLFYDIFVFLSRYDNSFHGIIKCLDCIAFKTQFSKHENAIAKFMKIGVVEEEVQEKGKIMEKKTIISGFNGVEDLKEKFRNKKNKLSQTEKASMMKQLPYVHSLEKPNKYKIIIKFIQNSSFFNISESNTIVSHFIQHLSVEKVAPLQELYVELLCKYSTHTSSQLNKNIIQTLQVLCKSSNVKLFAISKFRELQNIINFSEIVQFFKELFVDNFKDSLVLNTILETLSVLSKEMKKNLFHDLWWFLNFQNLSNITYEMIIIVMIKNIKSDNEANQLFIKIKKLHENGILQRNNLIKILETFSDCAIFSQQHIEMVYKYLFKLFKRGAIDEKDEKSFEKKLNVLGNLLKKNGEKNLAVEITNELVNVYKRGTRKRCSSTLKQFEKLDFKKESEESEEDKKIDPFETKKEEEKKNLGDTSIFNVILLKNLKGILLDELEYSHENVKRLLRLYQSFLLKLAPKNFELYYKELVKIFLKTKFIGGNEGTRSKKKNLTPLNTLASKTSYFREILFSTLIQRDMKEVILFLKYYANKQFKRLGKNIGSRNEKLLNIHLKWIIENTYVFCYKYYKKNYQYPLLYYL